MTNRQDTEIWKAYGHILHQWVSCYRRWD